MKIYGGGGRKSDKPQNNKKEKQEKIQPTGNSKKSHYPQSNNSSVKPEYIQSKNSPSHDRRKKTKRNLTPKQKRRRILTILIVVLAIVLSGFALFKAFVKPPEFFKTTSEQTDSQGVDNGDALVITGESRKKDYFTFFVAATDKDGTRTDSMMVVSMDIAKGEVNVLNVPRDTYSDVNYRSNKKINGAYNKGIDGSRKELTNLLGFPFDKYIVFSFEDIANFVDIIGGVDYNIPTYIYYDDPSQDLHIHFQPGEQHLDGQEVVEFLRWRKNNDGSYAGGGDIGRIEKQQEFLKVLASKIMKPSNIVKIPKMADAIFSSVDTDIAKGQMVWLGIQAIKLGANSINMHVLPGEGRRINGLSYYVAFENQALDLINQYFNPYTYEITASDVDIVAPKATPKTPKPDPNEADSIEDSEGTDTENDTTPPRDITDDPEQPADNGNNSGDNSDTSNEDSGIDDGGDNNENIEPTPEPETPVEPHQPMPIPPVEVDPETDPEV